MTHRTFHSPLYSLPAIAASGMVSDDPVFSRDPHHSNNLHGSGTGVPLK